MLGTAAILFAALFCIEFVACQTADVVKEPETARNAVPEGTKLFGTLSKADSHLEILKVRHPYDTIDDHSERIIPEQDNGKYEAILPSGWYRFKVDGKNSGGTVAIREGLGDRKSDNLCQIIFETRNGAITNFSRRVDV